VSGPAVPGPQGAVSPDGGAARGRRGGGERRMVPPAEPRSYYGQPVIAKPVWTPEIAAYFFAGGLAGAAAPMAAGARLGGNVALARRAALAALAGAAISPVLLIKDLGRPERFFRMLRVFKPTSPMSVGTWTLTTFGTCTGLATGWQVIGLPRARIGVPAQALAALTGPVISTYTAVLISNTAVPVWHEARRSLPWVFAGSSLASAGGLLVAVTPRRAAGPARAMAVGGAALEVAASVAMERRLDPRVKATYEAPSVKPAHQASRALAAAGGLVVAAAARRSRLAGIAGGLALVAGSACARWAIYKAGTVSADDPQQTIGPQRDRRDGRHPVKPRDAPVHPAPDAPPAPQPGIDVPGPSASGPGMPPAQDDPIAPRRGA
jgi:hypothetical protein